MYSEMNSSVGAAATAAAGAAASPTAASAAVTTVTVMRRTDRCMAAPCYAPGCGSGPRIAVRLWEPSDTAEAHRGEVPVNVLECARADAGTPHVSAMPGHAASVIDPRADARGIRH